MSPPGCDEGQHHHSRWRWLGTASAPGVPGADVWSSHAVQPGDHLKIRVGGGARSLAVGGSASAVVRADNSPLVVAGGGGGSDITCSPNVSGGSGASGSAAGSMADRAQAVRSRESVGTPTVQNSGGSAAMALAVARGIYRAMLGIGVEERFLRPVRGGGYGGNGTTGGAGGNASTGEVGGASAAFAGCVLTLNGGGGGAGFGGGGAGSASKRHGNWLWRRCWRSACGAGGAGGSFADASPSGDPQQFFTGPFVDGTSYGHGGASPLAGNGYVRISWNPPAHPRQPLRPPARDSPHRRRWRGVSSRRRS